MPESGPRVQKHARLPGRPGDASLATHLRRRFNRIFFPCFFTAPLPILAVMCLFEREADAILRLFGYNKGFVSSFPFIRSLYNNVNSTLTLEYIDIGYFHVLDAALWVSIVAWTLWLIMGFVCLKQCDASLQTLASGLSSRFGESRLLMYLTLPLPAFLFILHFSAETKIIAIPEIFLLLKNIPGVFFFLLTTTYYYGVVFSSISLLYFGWKLFGLFRQNRSKTFDRSDSSKEKDAAR
jgi:hypothetical protein